MSHQLCNMTALDFGPECTDLRHIDSKLGIWLCSQPIIDLNSQSNFYDVLTSPYKYLVQHNINTLYKTTCTEDNLRKWRPSGVVLGGGRIFACLPVAVEHGVAQDVIWVKLIMK